MKQREQVKLDLFKTWTKQQRKKYGNTIPFGFVESINSRVISFKNSFGYWEEVIYNKDQLPIIKIDSNGFWFSKTYDKYKTLLTLENNFNKPMYKGERLSQKDFLHICKSNGVVLTYDLDSVVKYKESNGYIKLDKPETLSLESLWKTSVPELKKIAKKFSIDNYSKLTKSPLVRAISISLGYDDGKKQVSKSTDPKDHDQYFTKPNVAKKCTKILYEFLEKYKLIDKNTLFVEPSVGAGHFASTIPSNNLLTIDIDPSIPANIHMNFYDYKVTPNTVVFGNPPFGKRGSEALRFINHSSDAKVVAFILPMTFDSIGKGSARFRVKGMKLIESHPLNHNSFLHQMVKNPMYTQPFKYE